MLQGSVEPNGSSVESFRARLGMRGGDISPSKGAREMIKNISLVLFNTLLFIGCGDGSKVPAATGKTVCMLFDLSGTTNKPQIRHAYVDNFKSIIDHITHGDAITAALITQFSAGE